MVKSYPYEIFSGECILVDHVSGFIRIKQKIDMNNTGTFKAKLTFDRKDKSIEVAIRGYYTGNRVFDEPDYIEDMLKNQQNIRFSGACASNKNGE